MTKALNAPAYSQEKQALNVIAASLEFIDAAKAQQERAKQMPHNQIKARYDLEPRSLIDASVLKCLGKGGSLVDEEG